MIRFSLDRRGLLAAGSALALTMSLTATAFAGGSSTGSLSVSATISTVCTISANGALSFNVTDLTANTDSSQTMAIACTNSGTPTSVSFSTGSNGGASGCTTANGGAGADNRCLKSGTNYLAYQIYSDSPGGTVFARTGNSTTAETSTGNFTVYGRVPSGQTAPAGSGYADTLTATVNY